MLLRLAKRQVVRAQKSNLTGRPQALYRRRISVAASTKPGDAGVSNAIPEQDVPEQVSGNPLLTGELVAAAKATAPWPAQLVEFLRSDHAGETGAVWIYRGAIAGVNLRESIFGLPPASSPRSQAWRKAKYLITHHIGAEETHLRVMNELLTSRQKSLLGAMWKAAGWALGFFPTFIAGPAGLFATVAAVETYVETHYMAQIVLLKSTNSYPEVASILEACCADEVEHQTDAANQYFEIRATGASMEEHKSFYSSLSFVGRLWFDVVTFGSKIAVGVAKKV